MRKFLIAAHGHFASGIKSSLDIIVGETKALFIIDAYVDGNKSIENDIKKVLETLTGGDELIVFSDLMGGSITNQILRHAKLDQVHIVSGVNLPLIIDVILADSTLSIPEAVGSAIVHAKEQIVYVNQLIKEEKI